jgi:ribosome-binding protein aMBF1 (putative translation factor)
LIWHSYFAGERVLSCGENKRMADSPMTENRLKDIKKAAITLQTPIHSPEDVGAIIRKLRLAKEWTQKRLAEEVGNGTTQKDISRWESGTHIITVENLLQMPDALNATIWIHYQA